MFRVALYDARNNAHQRSSEISRRIFCGRLRGPKSTIRTRENTRGEGEGGCLVANIVRSKNFTRDKSRNFTGKMLGIRKILTLSLGNPIRKRKKKKNTLSGASQSIAHARRHVSRLYVRTSWDEMRKKSDRLAGRRTTRTSGTDCDSLTAKIFLSRPCARRTPFLLVREEGLSTISAAVHQRGIGRVGMAEKENSLRVPHDYCRRRTPALIDASGSRSERNSRHLGTWGRGARKTTRKTTDSLRTWLVRSKRSSVT